MAQLKFAALAIAALAFLCLPLQTDAGACDDYNCVEGDCVEVSGFPPVKCVCKGGWSNILGMSALSCVIPDCDFNLTCANSSDKVHNKTQDSLASFDIFNPCSYDVCGEGDCIKDPSNSNHSYICSCHQGYVNLLNSSSGVCVSDCSIGANCNQLGINLGPSSSPSNSSSTAASDSSNGFVTRLFDARTPLFALGAVLLFLN